jgi:hypothetical protein
LDDALLTVHDSRMTRACLTVVALVALLTACGSGPEVKAAATTGAGGGTCGAGAGGVGSGGATGGAPASDYSVHPLPTNLPRLVIFKREISADRCVRITIAQEAGPGIGIQTDSGWTTELVEITDHASDCALEADGLPVMPLGQVVQAQRGCGTITTACSLHVQATLSFPAAYPWVPASDALDADVPIPSTCNLCPPPC